MAGKPGQGRKFVEEDALDAAMAVFWEHGYEGASLSELTSAMGINPPSLYRAFGSKEGLFFAVVDRYRAMPENFVARAIEEEDDGPTLAHRILREAAVQYPADGHPGGCLVISAAVTVSEANTHVAERLAAMRKETMDALASRPGCSPEQARFVAATLQGMSQQARDGAGTEALRSIAGFAATAFDRMAPADR